MAAALRRGVKKLGTLRILSREARFNSRPAACQIKLSNRIVHVDEITTAEGDRRDFLGKTSVTQACLLTGGNRDANWETGLRWIREFRGSRSGS